MVLPSSPPVATASADDATPRVAGPAARRTRALAVALLLALVALGLAWELRLAPTGSGALAIKVAPLALLLPGLLKYRLWSYRALSLLVWLYVAEGLVRATSERGAAVPLAIAEVVLATALFVACAAHVRLRLAAGRAPA
jgi:uncharacterized membrane protein